MWMGSCVFLGSSLAPHQMGGALALNICVGIFCGPEAHACLSVCVGGGVWGVWEEAGDSPLHLLQERTPHLTKGWQY